MQFLHAGYTSGKSSAYSRHYNIEFTSEPTSPGIWWGEGKVIRICTEEHIATIDFSCWLCEHPTNRLDRLELLSPKERQPWLAVDYQALRQRMQCSAHALNASKVWLNSHSTLKWIDEHSANLELSKSSSLQILLMLCTTPTEEHQLKEVFDGTRWHPWSALSLTISLQRQNVVVSAETLPEPCETIEKLATFTPWWVEFRKNDEKVVRWTQSQILRSR